MACNGIQPADRRVALRCVAGQCFGPQCRGSRWGRLGRRTAQAAPPRQRGDRIVMTQITAPRTAAQSSVLLVMPMQHPAGEEILEEKCGQILRTGIDPSEIADAISEVDTLIVRGPGFISARTIEQATSLRFISVSGAGYDCVDIDAATEHRLPVLFYPGFSALPVAEYVIGALVICSRRLGTADRECRSPDFDWSKRTTNLMGNLLSGSTLGLIGLGRIGRIVA